MWLAYTQNKFFRVGPNISEKFIPGGTNFRGVQIKCDSPHPFEEMASHTWDPYIPVIMACHTDGLNSNTTGKTVSHTGGAHFHQGIPIFLEKWGLRVPILPVI